MPPVPARAWSETAREAIAILSEEASRTGLEPSDNRHVHNLPSTLVHHPELMKRYFPFLDFLLRQSSLPVRYRELAILRVAWLRQAEYAWTQHVQIARSIGISDLEIGRLTDAFDPAEWEPVEALIVQAAGELIRAARLSEETWNGLMPHLGAVQTIELIYAVGNYDLLAMIMNSTEMELEAGLEDARFARFVQRRTV